MKNHGSTLLLNADYMPIRSHPLSTLRWKDAIKLQCLGHAVTLEEYDDWIVHSPKHEFLVPAVMITREYVKFKRFPKFTTENIRLRDNFTCQYCGEKFQADELTKDHVNPRKIGGKTAWDNIVSACLDCNSKKGHRLWKPINEPYRPNMIELEAKARHYPVKIYHPSWENYIGWPAELIIHAYKNNLEGDEI